MLVSKPVYTINRRSCSSEDTESSGIVCGEVVSTSQRLVGSVPLSGLFQHSEMVTNFLIFCSTTCYGNISN